jgi:hypothetical protein
MPRILDFEILLFLIQLQPMSGMKAFVTPQNRHLANYSNHTTIRTMSLWKRTTKQNVHKQHTHYAGGIK